MLTFLPQITLAGVVRVSLGIGYSEEDVDALIRVLGEVSGRSGAAGGWDSPSSRGTSDVSKVEIRWQVDDVVRATIRESIRNLPQIGIICAKSRRQPL